MFRSVRYAREYRLGSAIGTARTFSEWMVKWECLRQVRYLGSSARFRTGRSRPISGHLSLFMHIVMHG
jgi:hypothetical protein